MPNFLDRLREQRDNARRGADEILERAASVRDLPEAILSKPSRIAAAAASEGLTRTLRDLAKEGILPHCADPETSHMWLSEDAEDRARATKWCRGCPIFTECGEAASARRERFGVWSGQDRTRPPGKVGRPAKPGRNHRKTTPP
jgi:hypothetical protein